MSNEILLIPSNLKYKSAPYVDQTLSVSIVGSEQPINEYDRNLTASLATAYDNERQLSTIFRPTFKINYIYNNSYLGTTNYVPFRDNLYYFDPLSSLVNLSWSGYPQYYEFDFHRPDLKDSHFSYTTKSAYTYNWTSYVSYAHSNDYNKNLTCFLNNSNFSWTVRNGIPFVMRLTTQNGSNIISFECITSHGLKVGESVELSVSYGITNIFEVFSLGNGITDSEKYVFNVFNAGYTGSTFSNGITGTFKRVINPTNLNETKSKYYIRKHKILTNVNDSVLTKIGYERNAFEERKRLELSSLTPNNITRVSQKNSSNTYSFTVNRDINISSLRDNQKRPVTELYLTIINKGYSGYFNLPNLNNVGLKQGWTFNITKLNNSWWDSNNTNSDSNIKTSNYTLTDVSGNTKTFYYNNDLMSGDTIDGDFCEWNDYEQTERVISEYNHKISYNQNNFQSESTWTTNPDGFYYQPHHPIILRVFSDVIESVDLDKADQVPSWSFFSVSEQQFRWRDLYEYGFIDDTGKGVNYPYLNNSHYPFSNVFFKLSSEGLTFNDQLLGINVANQPIIDGCE